MNDTDFSDNSLVTVVIPTYNRSMLVMDAIASVLAQSYTNWELIVADDGSEDDTVEKIRSIADPRVRLLVLPHCGNIATVRNAGVRAGSGPWIAFLDSDDLWIPEKLETQLILLAGAGKRWSYGGYELMNEKGATIPCKAGKYTPFSGWIVKDLLTTEASVNMGTLIMERTLFNELGGFDTEPLINYREDYDLALRLAMKAETIASPELLMRVREHDGRSENANEGGSVKDRGNTNDPGNASDLGNARTASVYQHFIKNHSGKTGPEKELVRIARRRMGYHLAEMAIGEMHKGRYLRALRQLVAALRSGDRVRHLLSVLRRGILPGRVNNH
jgi:glycosyltransferase involved in cell wall biosynthesis